jgi:hypothetical protein
MFGKEIDKLSQENLYLLYGFSKKIIMLSHGGVIPHSAFPKPNQADGCNLGQ